jgi:rhamnosyl/mannosyltransferase
VIPFGIHLQPFLRIDRAPPRKRTQRQPLVLAVGPLSAYKGLEYLVEAMERVDGWLVIVGDGEMRPALQMQIRRLGLEGRVHLAGRIGQAELLDWYTRADVFCLPSSGCSEAFGLAMVEAMAAGLPVVSTDLPTGVRAVNAHRDSGLVVPPANSAALAEALDLLAGDVHLRYRMGLAARRRAREKFGRELMGRRLVNLYKTILGSASQDEVCRGSTDRDEADWCRTRR